MTKYIMSQKSGNYKRNSGVPTQYNRLTHQSFAVTSVLD